MFIVEFETDSPILKSTREAVPEMQLTFEDERMANHTNQIRMLFLASGGDFQRFEAAMEADSTVEDCTVISTGENDRLYRMTYAAEVANQSLLELLVELDLVTLDAETIHDGWRLRRRFPTQQSLEECRAWFEERDLPFNSRKLHSRTSSEDNQHALDVTDKQYEALRRA